MAGADDEGRDVINVKATVNVRTLKGKFPQGSKAKALAEVRPALVRDVNRAFDTKSDPVSGSPWAPTKFVYGHPLLQKTGALKAGAVAAAAGATVAGSSITAKVKTPAHAGFQAKGTRYITARRFLGASIGAIGQLAKALKREGLRVFRGKA